jgi:hypothetical protein
LPPVYSKIKEKRKKKERFPEEHPTAAIFTNGLGRNASF